MPLPFAQRLPGFRPSHLVVHYNEIGLKGRNRGYFEERLRENLRAALRGLGGESRVRRLYGRLAIDLDPETSWTAVAERVARVFGVAYFVPAVVSGCEIDAIGARVEEALAGAPPARGFAVECKRANKDLPFNSMDVLRAIGARAQSVTDWPVDLDDPEVTIRVEIVNRQAYTAIGRVEGPGGLPTGVAGHVVALLSGGIDSPVAAYRLLRRGTRATYVHFHSYPHTSRESIEKVRELAGRIQPLGLPGELWTVPFADLQRRIVGLCPAPLRVILYRRFMVRAAEALASRVGALAIVTGESLGQVASQTLENIATIDAAVSLPILRPLIGMDKIEIIAEARRIGTFDTSIEPHDDACSFLMPPSPATKTRAHDLESAEEPFEVPAEVENLLAAAERTTIAAAAARPA